MCDLERFSQIQSHLLCYIFVGKLYTHENFLLLNLFAPSISTCLTLIAIQRRLPESPLSPSLHWQLALQLMTL